MGLPEKARERSQFAWLLVVVTVMFMTTNRGEIAYDERTQSAAGHGTEAEREWRLAGGEW